MKARGAARSLCLAILLGTVCRVGFAQEIIDLRQNLPKITFDALKNIGDTDLATEYSLSFPSAYISDSSVNNVVPLRILIPKAAKANIPVVVILHYWGARDIKVERSMADQLARRGIASIIVTLPYHLARAPVGTRSGQLAIQPDPEKLKATMNQAAWDVRRTVDFIESRPELDSTRIGIFGTSLGALVSSLAYGVDSRFSRAAFVLGGADLTEIVWSSSILVGARDSLRSKGYTVERLRAELTSVEPLTYLESRRQSSAFVIGGKFDTVIPPSSTKALIAAFDDPKTLWLETGHYGGIFVQSRILKECANYFAAEFAGLSYTAPKRIFSPTLRVGIQATWPQGFDIGVGIDFWKSNQRGDVIGTGMLTPRGPQIFLGTRISTGLAIGVSGWSNRIQIGILWSRVL